MSTRLWFLPALLVLAGAAPQGIERAPGESALRFAARVLGRSEDVVHAIDARWNDTPAVLADYLSEQAGGGELRQVVALVPRPGGTWRRIAVTTAEEEGGVAEIAAIGFANADRDADRELIVLLKWPQVHYDYQGAFYEVRLFDTPRPGGSSLTYLVAPSRMFGHAGCDCGFRDGRRQHYRYTTIAAIRQELTRRGY